MTPPMPVFSARSVRQACGGHIQAGTNKAQARGVSTDTRTMDAGQMFIALKGENHDAHDFLPQAIRNGASILLVEKDRAPRNIPDRTTVITVKDTTRALMDVAAWHRQRLEGRVIAITGSCGKSTVKNMLGTILSRTGRCSVAQKSFNNKIGVSLSLLAARTNDDHVVLELGTNHPGEIDELARIAQPHAGIITCIGRCHLEGLGNLQGVREAKAELIPHIQPQGLLVLNADDENCASLAGRYDGRTRTFGLDSGADLRPRITTTQSDGHQETFMIGETTFRIPVPGQHNVLNAAAAICMAHWAGASEEDCHNGLMTVSVPGMRFEQHSFGGTEYILDCYNSNPTAMRAAIETFMRMPVEGRRLVVFGDMLELGASSPRLHEEMGMLLASRGINTLVAVGQHAEHVMQGWDQLAGPQQRAMRIPDVDKAWLFIWEITAPGDAVLLKGSRDVQLERITDAIAERAAERQRGDVA